MAFDNVKDPNASRAQADQNAPAAFTAPEGSTGNQTLQGMGLEDANSAAKTAQALGALAQDVVGNAVAVKQKEDFIEAYAGAGAGRSVAELRNETPAWESMFGPTATVQGAQSRALNTAVADLGNEGLAMVDQFKDKDPEEFHKALAKTVSAHFTGDPTTDTLITQESVSKVKEIAAAHYKAHAKYIQDLNLQTSENTINTTIKTLKTALAMPAEQQSEEGMRKFRQAVVDSMHNTYGMDALTYRKMIVGIVANDLESGSTIARDIILPDLAPSQAWGKRADGANKGEGWLGVMQRPDGKVSSEISVGVNIGGKEVEIPTMVPGLSNGELTYLLNTDPKAEGIWKTDLGKSILGKAVDHATTRLADNKSPFADTLQSLPMSTEQSHTILAANGTYTKIKKEERTKVITDYIDRRKMGENPALPAFQLTTEERKQVYDVSTAENKKSLDNYVAQVKSGDLNADMPVDTSGNPLNLSHEDWAQIYEANDKGQKVINETFKVQRAAGRVQLINAAENGASTTQLLAGVATFQKQFGTLDEGEIKEIIGTKRKKEAGDKAALEHLANYKAGFKDEVGQELFFGQLRSHLKGVGFKSKDNPNGIPGMQGEEAVLREIANRNEPGGNANLKYQFTSNLGKPRLDDGSVNPRFAPTFLQFHELYKMNPEVALAHIDNADLAARVRDGMRGIDAGTETPQSLMKSWDGVKPVAASDIKFSVGDDGVKTSLKHAANNEWYNVGGIFGKKSVVTPYMEGAVLQTAARLKQRNPALSNEAAVKQASSDFWKINESVNSVPQFFGKTSFTARMGLADPKATADDALDHFKEKYKFQYVRTVQHDAGMEIHRTNKDGSVDLDPQHPIFISYREMGNMYNKEVVEPERTTLLRIQGKTNDDALEGRLDALDWLYKKQGIQTTRQQRVDSYNAQSRTFSNAVSNAKESVGGLVKQVLHEPVVIKDNIKHFWNTHEIGIPEMFKMKRPKSKDIPQQYN